jgi:hypothetical protein
MGTLLVGMAIMALCACAAVAGYLAVQHRWATELHKQQNDVAGFIYGIIGLAYGVLMASVVVAVWQEFTAAQLTTEQEANAVADLYEFSDDLPGASGARIRELAREYLQSVIDDEWPLLMRGQTSSRTTDVGMELGRAVRAATPQSEREQAIFQQALTVDQTLRDSRRLRLFQSRSGLHPSLWVVLIAGGFLTVTFTYLFGLANTRAHALMIAALGGTIGGVLFMIQVTDYPFRGDVRVEPTAFEVVRELTNQP